jgi:hypothetical protein
MKMALEWLLVTIAFYFISTLITSILIFLSIHKIISRLYLIPIFIFHIIISIVEKGDEPARHGTINAIFLPLVTLFYFSILEIIYRLYKCYKKKKFIRFTIAITAILTLIISLEINLRLSCRGWENGLGNSKIDFYSEKSKVENGCYPSKPTRCLISLMNNKIQFNKYLGSESCDRKCDSKSELVKYAPHLKDARNVAYPLIKFKDLTKDIYVTELSPWIINNMYDYDKKDNTSTEDYLKYEPEAIIHFDDTDRGILSINIKRNETLVKEKLKKIEETKDEPVKFENILFLYIDSISRVQFLKRMPETRKILEKYYSDDILNIKDENYLTFQFLKYLNFEVKTTINTVPMFSGAPYFVDENRTEHGIQITKYLDDHGYITGFGNEQCAKVIFDITPESVTHINFYPFDHEINEIFCDPHYATPGRYWNNLRGTNSVIKRCLYGKESYKYLFEFSDQFLKAYEDYPRIFLRLAFQEAHETSMEVIKLLDKDFSVLLNSFIQQYNERKWAIFIVSDHGNGLTFYRGEDWRKEISFASFFLLLPRDKISNFNLSIIRENEQRIVTPYDIYNTLLDMFGFNQTYYNKKGNSTLGVVTSKFKTCQFFTNEMREIRKQYCTCIPYD